MKRYLPVFLLLFSIQGFSQLAVNVIVPPGGVVQKQQLWNLLVTNANSSPLLVRIEIVLTETGSGQPVLSATTGMVTVPPGVKQFNAATVGLVQYSNVNGNYQIDPGPAGLLPVGKFTACYNFIVEGEKAMIQECQLLDVQPLNPLLLNFPDNHAVLENENPVLSWIPLSSAQSLSNLTYSLKIVEVNSGQSTSDAIQKNLPLFTAQHLSTNSLFYGPSFPLLDRKKRYAWQVSAMNNGTETVKSEIWDFSVKDKVDKGMLKPSPPYVRFKKAPAEANYCIYYGHMRFAYYNETSDTTWAAELFDISIPNARSIPFKALDTVALTRGENLIEIPGREVPDLQSGHIYLLQLTNTRHETWQLKFEYRKED